MAEAEAGPLSPADVESFIERGYLWLRRAFAPETARHVVHDVFRDGGTMKRAYRRSATGSEPFDIHGLSLTDCSDWPAERLDVETGFQAWISDFSPRLHGALEQLTGTLPVRRGTIGENWILNLDLQPRPDPEELDRAQREAFWHIDTPGPDTRLFDRFDAFTLLMLWSDVEELGGGTLYSVSAFDGFIDALLDTPDGIDTLPEDWATSIMRDCDDIQSQVGRAGDVLITHGFMLHARPPNYRRAVRILENPTVMVGRELNYLPDNPAPSPVEEAVIRRIRRRSPLPVHVREAMENRRRHHQAALRIVEYHPARFLPGPPGELPRDTALMAARQLFELWVERHARAIGFENRTPLAATRAAAVLARTVMLPTRAVQGAKILDSVEDPGFADRAYHRLVLGLASPAGLSHAVVRIVRAAGFEAEIVRHHDTVLVRIEEDGAPWVFDVWSDEDGPYAERAGGDTRPPGAPPKTPPPGILDELLASETPPHELSPAWVEYLRLRTRILLHEEPDPAAALRAYLDTHRVGGLTRRLVEAHIRAA